MRTKSIGKLCGPRWIETRTVEYRVAAEPLLGVANRHPGGGLPIDRDQGSSMAHDRRAPSTSPSATVGAAENSKNVIAVAGLIPHHSRMTTRERVAQFVSMIEKNQFLESIPLFYAEDMTAQENGDPPRGGRAAQLENERGTLARFRFVESRAVSVLVDGDRSTIQWVFDIEVGPAIQIRLEEVAVQTWRDDLIVAERYFYDPGQLTKVRPGR